MRPGEPGELGAISSRYEPISRDRLDARLKAADKPGEHLWIMTAAWHMPDPASASNPDVIKLMDRENLVLFLGPGCMKCERQYSAKMAKRRCLGSLDHLQ